MAYPYEVELTITSARDLKNVNWRYGALRPYAVAWIDPKNKCSTRVDEEGDNNPCWDETLIIPLPPRASLKNSTLFIDIVHAGNEDDIKPLIGSAQLNLDDVGINERARYTLQLRRPSGRPHGKVEIKIAVREPRYRAPDAYYAPPYGVPPSGSRDYPPAYGAPPPQAYGETYSAPPVGYPYSEGGYGQPVYVEEERKSKFGGMGTGLAVGAVAGVLGGLAIAEGADYIEDKIADEAAEKVEDDIGYDGGYGDDDGGW